MSNLATPEEIGHVSQLLIQEEFDAETKAVIECNVTKDVKASPGSGKTTALLAKLIILANKMPLDSNKGICVLTHTNVAINEIKHKLGDKSAILFKYPNFFGTIQSFIDKYLAIPYYKERFPNSTLRNISDDYFKRDLERSFYTIAGILKKKDPELKKKVWSFALREGGEVIDFLMQIRYNEKSKLINVKSGKEIVFEKPRKGKNNWTTAEQTAVMDAFKEIYYNVIAKYGTLSYYDAYTFSNVYLKKHPQLKAAFSNRFSYLFIDEMQDTDERQTKIIDLMFDNQAMVVQRFGDPHQSIYNRVKAETNWNPTNFLQITRSKRFGDNIAKLLKTVCVSNNSTLATTGRNSLEPVLIVFDKPEDVLQKFCELVVVNTIDGKSVLQKSKDENIPIKAIGWVGEPNAADRDSSKYTIKSYFENFRKNLNKSEKTNLSSLRSFLKPDQAFTVKDYYDRILRILLQMLYLGYKKTNGRNYNTSLLLKDLKENHEIKYGELHEKIAKWAKAIHEGTTYNEAAIQEIKTYIQSEFFPIFGIVSNDYLTEFIDGRNEVGQFTTQEIQANNIYSNATYPGLNIELATIHSSKGETHAATLYFETSYQAKGTNKGHESERIKEQLKGKPYSSRKSQKLVEETLKMSYVGLSRARYLLCFAIHKDRYDTSLDKNVNPNSPWNVIDISRSTVLTPN